MSIKDICVGLHFVLFFAFFLRIIYIAKETKYESFWIKIVRNRNTFLGFSAAIAFFRLVGFATKDMGLLLFAHIFLSEFVSNLVLAIIFVLVRERLKQVIGR